MPIYNEERFLQHALDSLLAQDCGNIQILIEASVSALETNALADS